MINKFLRHNKRGFTLIETLIAVLILSTAIAGPLTVASRGLTAALVAQDQIIAYYLAQDALEFVRFARDTNRLAGSDWLTGSGGSGEVVDLSNCVSPNVCYLDSTGQSPSTPTVCGGTACNSTFASNKRFFYRNSAGLYNYNQTGTTRTIFWRRIILAPPTGQSSISDEAVLTVTVYWSDQAGIVRDVTMQENLFNWQ